MDKDAYIAWLLDFYGALLTDRQRYILSQHLDEDFSITELARLEKISRQGVYDAIRKGENQLIEFEEKLGLLKRYFALRDSMQQALIFIGKHEHEAAEHTLISALERDED